MAKPVENLHEILCEILGSRHVYYQPPESIRMTYPAIVYSLNDVHTNKADGKQYINYRRYQVQYISRDPDETVIDALLELEYSSFDRRFIVDNLYHDCVQLYF